MKVFQRTISNIVSVTGVGLHSGKKITLRLKPMPAGSGIYFKRSDLDGSKQLKADALTVGVTENNTSIGKGGELYSNSRASFVCSLWSWC